MKNISTSALFSCGLLLLFAFVDSSAIAAKLGLFQKQQDIGVTPKKGKAKFDSKKEQYIVTGGGANMWEKTDAFHFVYKQVSGDFTLTADVRFLGKGVENHRKGALIVRQSLTPDSAYADVALHGDGLTSLQYRETPGAETEEKRSEVKAPGRIRIERHGNQFTMEAGNPGEQLTSTGPVTVNLQDPVYVGLAMCSHNADVLETAVFSHVEVQSGAQTQTGELFQFLAKVGR